MECVYFIVVQNSRKGFAMSENALYKELGVLTKEKERWEESIPYVASLLDHGSEKIRAKALWLLGETDPNRVVRIHSAGAIKATGMA